MRAVEITAPGGPEVLVLVQRPVPEPGAGEVLIRVAAAGVNRPDILQRLGSYPPPPGASDLPGLEVSGTVTATGAEVEFPRAGDTVCALVAGGGYAEFCVAPAAQCLPIPARLSFPEAAAIPETFFTVWSNVFQRGRLVAGETLLVHGGSGGIGTTAIALGRAFGARVFATAGGPDKCEAIASLGAERPIDYLREDFVPILLELTQSQGVDVILDILGGEYFARNLAALADQGRLVQIAWLQGRRAELDLARLMTRRLTITGSTLRPRTVAEKGAIADALRTSVWPLLEAGTVAPVIHAVLPLERAAEAHRLMESRKHVGKIVLVP